MPANLANHAPILAYQTSTNTTEQTQDYLEAAGQTYLDGVPVQLNGSQYLEEWVGAASGTAASGIVGISTSQAMNLPSAGAGAAPAFGSYGFPGTPTTYGSVPNQPSAVNIPSGATFSTGSQTVMQAVPTTIFIGQVDNSTGGAYAPSIANVGEQYGLAKDATGHWYIDLSNATPGSGTCVLIVGLYTNDLAPGSTTTEINGGRLLFKFIPSTTVV